MIKQNTKDEVAPAKRAGHLARICPVCDEENHHHGADCVVCHSLLPKLPESAPAQAGVHTPGQWTCEYDTFADSAWWVVAPKAETPIAKIWAGTHSEANARLIASAPALLVERDALRAAMKAIIKACKEGVIQRNETGKPQWSALDHMEAIASTALALSKGGQ
jgi:hypothetical protein